ncbi:MAG: hypothetical protein DHS20C02_12580 [Micavibrio sp.]|nr:MAG: hypothetical protein DHS20C02_12580 [Micavibrio sp.]
MNPSIAFTRAITDDPVVISRNEKTASRDEKNLINKSFYEPIAKALTDATGIKWCAAIQELRGDIAYWIFTQRLKDNVAVKDLLNPIIEPVEWSAQSEERHIYGNLGKVEEVAIIAKDGKFCIFGPGPLDATAEMIHIAGPSLFESWRKNRNLFNEFANMFGREPVSLEFPSLPQVNSNTASSKKHDDVASALLPT